MKNKIMVIYLFFNDHTGQIEMEGTRAEAERTSDSKQTETLPNCLEVIQKCPQKHSKDTFKCITKLAGKYEKSSWGKNKERTGKQGQVSS